MIKDLLVKLLKYLTQAGFEATHTQELDAANARIAQLEEQVANLQTVKAAIMADYNALAAKETAAQNDLQSLQAQNRALASQYDALQGKLKGIEDAAKAVANQPIDAVLADLGGGSPK